MASGRIERCNKSPISPSQGHEGQPVAVRQVEQVRRAGRRAIAAVVLIALTSGCTSTPPSLGPSAEPTLAATAVAPTVLASPPPTALPSPTPIFETADGWLRVPAQASVAAGQLSNVVWVGTRGGTVADPNARFVGSGSNGLIDSNDGLTWHQQVPLAGTIGLLAVGPRGVVAVGSIDDQPFSWTSVDGLTWTAGTKPFPVPDTSTTYVTETDIVATDNGWLAVGREDPNCALDCNLAPVRAIVWTSLDGLTWTRVADQASLSHAAMTAVTRGGPGYVAVGQAGKHGAVWTSTDGKLWSRVPDATVFSAPLNTDQTFGASMTGVTASGGTIVAVGLVGTQGDVGSALAWWSTDGRHWSRATGDHFLYGQIFTVGVGLGGVVAAGPSGGKSCQGGIWWSADGHAWRCIATDKAMTFSPYAIAQSGNLLVVAGLGPDPTVDPALADEAAPVGAIWVRDIPN
jgi:hypothetical protein